MELEAWFIDLWHATIIWLSGEPLNNTGYLYFFSAVAQTWAAILGFVALATAYALDKLTNLSARYIDEMDDTIRMQLHCRDEVWSAEFIVSRWEHCPKAWWEFCKQGGNNRISYELCNSQIMQLKSQIETRDFVRKQFIKFTTVSLAIIVTSLACLQAIPGLAALSGQGFVVVLCVLIISTLYTYKFAKRLIVHDGWDMRKLKKKKPDEWYKERNMAKWTPDQREKNQ